VRNTKPVHAAAVPLRAIPVELAVLHDRRDVDARPHGELLVRRPAHRAVEAVADEQDRVAQLFGIEPGAVAAPTG